MAALRITEIFYSLQGETRTVGLPTVFIRLTGCPLRCTYCDTAYAFQGGDQLSIDEVLQKVAYYSPRYVTVTGGEPLAQQGCRELLTRLCEFNYEVSLETSGAIDLSGIDPQVVIVMDLKTPGSKEVHRNYYQNIQLLTKKDQVKFVICDYHDYEWSKEMLQKYNLSARCEVLFSPSHDQLTNQDLADWIIRDNLPVRFQLQMHKYIWGDVRGK